MHPVDSAKDAGLRYVSDTRPGIRRKRMGKGFAYYTADGSAVRDAQELLRIQTLGIPPAWTDVWICPRAHGHLQATGRDAKGRKQYRYHPRWREIRDQTKYAQMCAFGEALPAIRAQVDRDMARPGLAREKVLATVLRLLELTLIRIGNEEYVRMNHSFGLTTLRDRHVSITGATLRFEFRGKGGKAHAVQVNDRRLAKVVQHCQDLPGQELFQYLDDTGQRRSIDAHDVNEYLRTISGRDFTAKDFRTWAGALLAIETLQSYGACESAAQLKHNIVQAIKTVASKLGNTPAICRKCYVNPCILEAYLKGQLIEALKGIAEQNRLHALPGLSPQEGLLLGFLRQYAVQEDRVAHAT